MVQNTKNFIQLRHQLTKNHIRQAINIQVGIFNIFKILFKTRKNLLFKRLFLAGPKVNWAYWVNDGILNQNQEHQKTDFATVDCDLNKNIVFYDFKNINFGQDFVYEWTDESEAQEFSVKLAQIRKRCPDVRVVIDPQIEWNHEIADQIVQKKVSVGQLAKSITDFNTKYYIDGMGMLFYYESTFFFNRNTIIFIFLIVLTFSPNVVLNDKLTYEFLKELKRLFIQNKLQLILTFGPSKDLSYVRPVTFE